MYWIGLIIGISAGIDVTYLNFSSSSNPTSYALNLTVGTGTDLSYSVEFWLRPIFNKWDQGNIQVMQDNNDWTVIYHLSDYSITFTSRSGNDYCRINSVPLIYWTHIAATYSKENSQTFSCYSNATFQDSQSNAPTSNKYPGALSIGNNFYGDVYDLRVWTSVALPQSTIYKNYTSYLTLPYPVNLIRYYRLIEETTTTIVKDYISGASVSLSSVLKNIWYKESPSLLAICAPGNYSNNANCYKCASNCGLCKSYNLAECFRTARVFLDFSQLVSKDSINLVYPAGIATIELWYNPNTWNLGLEIFSVPGLISIKQRGSSSNVSFYDGAGIEAHTFASSIGVWTHLAWVFISTGKARLYVNNTYQDVGWTNSTPYSIFYVGSNSTARFSGMISDIRLWSTVRNVTQILSNLNTLFTTVPTGLKKYCPINDYSSVVKCSDSSSAVLNSGLGIWRTQDCSTENCLIECPFQYYINIGGECNSCDPSCQACSGPSPANCTVCLPTDYQVAGQNNCYKSCPSPYVSLGYSCILACPYGYYNNANVCTLCISPCTACSNASYCLACIVGYTQFSSLPSNNCIANCSSGQYINSSFACSACNANCNQCYGTSTNCTQCSSTQYLYNSTCVNTCPLYTYLNYNNCYNCHSSCYNCTGPGSLECISPKPGYIYKDTQGNWYQKCPSYYDDATKTCLSMCPTKNYPLANLSCVACDPSCIECTGPSSSNCSSCSNYLYNGTCYGNCPSYTYSNSSVCYNCNSTCGTCYGNSNNCTSCSNSFPYQYESSCYSVCPSNTLTLQDDEECVDSCPTGYYQVGSNCIVCDSNCLSCTNNSTYCTSCASNNYLYNNTCVFTCPNGYYPQYSSCAPCDPSCSTCSSFNFCTSCKNPNLYLDVSGGTCNGTCNVTTYTLNNTCLPKCPEAYYYPAENPKVCLTCPVGCFTCTSNSVCQSCQDSYYAYLSICIAKCPSRYYTNYVSMSCGMCDPACLECIGNSLSDCTVCANGQLVYINSFGIGSCINSCPDGTYQTPTTCSYCMPTCKTCYNNSTCSSCLPGYYLTSNLNCSSTCNPGDIVSMQTSVCYPYSVLYPTGSIDLSSLVTIEITYPVQISKSIGYLNIYSMYNGSYMYQMGYNITSGSSISVGNKVITSVSSSSFYYNTSYTVELSAQAVVSTQGTNLMIPKGIWKFQTNPHQAQPLVVIINQGVIAFEVVKNTAFSVDASKSYDPNNATSVLTTSWFCYDYTSDYNKYLQGVSTSWADYIKNVNYNSPYKQFCSNWNYNTPPTGYVINVTNLNVAYEVLRFVFTLSSDSGLSSSASVFVLVVPSYYNPIQISGISSFSINVDKNLQISASNPVLTNPSGYIWTVSDKTLSYLTPLQGTWIITVEANSMIPSKTYTFSLTYSDASAMSSAVISITTNSQPTSGNITVDINTGLALTDKFTVQMYGWIDVNMPLSYSFYMFINSSSIGYELTGLQSESTLTAIYPGGQIQIFGYVYNSLESKSGTSINITVTPLHSIQPIVQQCNSESYNLMSENTVQVLSTVNAFAIELNYTYPDNSAVFGCKTSLMAFVSKAKILADEIFNTKGQSSNALYIYVAVIGSIENLIKDPVSSSLLSTAISTLNSINYTYFSLKPEIDYSGNGIKATSSQYVLSNDEINNLGETMANIILAISLSDYSDNFLSSISGLIDHMNTIFSVGSLITESPRILNLNRLNFQTSKLLLSNSVDINVTLGNGVGFYAPSSLGNSLNTTQISLVTGIFQNNPYKDTKPVLGQYMSVEVKDANTGSLIPVNNFNDSFIVSFQISRNELNSIKTQMSSSQGSLAEVFPMCTYWNSNSSVWSSTGCSLYNIGDIYKYFTNTYTPDSIPLKCSCNHLSQFSVSFTSSEQFQSYSYIINESDTTDFSTTKWETSLLLYLMISFSIVFFIGLSIAYYWDNYNPGLSIPSVETEKTFRYWDPNKVDAVLSQLEKEFIRQLTDSSKKDTTAAISKILKSGLVNKLMLENSKDLKENYEEPQKRPKQYPIEKLMKYDLDDDDNIYFRTKNYLEKGLDDPTHIPTLVSEPKPRQMNSRKDLENTVNQLKLHMVQLESNSAPRKTPIDLFLDKYDSSEKLPSALKLKLKLDSKELKRNDLQSLGIDCSEFAAIRVSRGGKIVPDSTLLTGGKYCKFYLAEKIVDEVRRFYGNLKVSYWTLFWMYVKKEHKYLSLFFNLHIEYTKKQMVTLVTIYSFIMLLCCQAYITYFNWEFHKTFNQSGVCVWGCNSEAQMLGGVVCAIIPWPFCYLCKYLFARNMIEFSATHSAK